MPIRSRGEETEKLLSAWLPRPTLLKTVTAYNCRAPARCWQIFVFMTKYKVFVVIRRSRSILSAHRISLQEAQLHGCKNDRIWFQSIPIYQQRSHLLLQHAAGQIRSDYTRLCCRPNEDTEVTPKGSALSDTSSFQCNSVSVPLCFSPPIAQHFMSKMSRPWHCNTTPAQSTQGHLAEALSCI